MKKSEVVTSNCTLAVAGLDNTGYINPGETVTRKCGYEDCEATLPAGYSGTTVQKISGICVFEAQRAATPASPMHEASATISES